MQLAPAALRRHRIAAVFFAAILGMLLLTLPAFGSFFLGEDFIYVGQFRDHADNYFAAIASPTDNVFFRPVFVALNLIWMAILPLDPAVHHARNFAMSVLALVLLDQVLRRLPVSTTARLVALVFFAASKVHFTTIGYINAVDSTVSVCLLFATVLFLLRHAQRPSRLDRTLAIIFGALAIFTKDYGIAVLFVMGGLVAYDSSLRAGFRQRLRWWAVQLAPLALAVPLYFIARRIVLADAPALSIVYDPQLSLFEMGRKGLALAATLANLSFFDGATGAHGLPGWLGAKAGIEPNVFEGVGLAMLLLLAAFTLRARSWTAAEFLFPWIWIAAYAGPTILTRNLQVYYFTEPLAGATVLLALALTAASSRLIGLWLIALLFIGINGAVGNYTPPAHHWQFAARLVSEIRGPVLDHHRGGSIDTITFATTSPDFWLWALTADGHGPMLPELMRSKTLQVQIVGYQGLPAALAVADATHLVFDIDNGFIEYDGSNLPAPISIRDVSPSTTSPGLRFNAQPNGQSAVGITAEGATPGTVVLWDNLRLVTAYGSSAYVTAFVPDDLIAQEGVHRISLTNGAAVSNSVQFVISPTDAVLRALLLRELRPNATRAGVSFGQQPNGQAAIAVVCENALPGTVIVFEGRPLATAYGDSTFLSAFVPPELYRSAGRYEVFLRHDTRESNHIEFTVNP